MTFEEFHPSTFIKGPSAPAGRSAAVTTNRSSSPSISPTSTTSPSRSCQGSSTVWQPPSVVTAASVSPSVIVAFMGRRS